MDTMIGRKGIGDQQGMISRRMAARIRLHGVAALTSLEEPVVASILDISPSGVSFIHSSGLNFQKNKVSMDILLFDCLTGVEHCLNQVKGRMIWKERLPCLQRHIPITRFGFEFLELSSLNSEVLQACLDEIAEDPFLPYLTA